MQQTRLPFVLLFPAFLAACGGSGSTPTIQNPATPPAQPAPPPAPPVVINPPPLSSAGFAQFPIQGKSEGVVFNQPEVTTLSSDGGPATITEQDFTIKVDNIGTINAVATLTVDGEEFILPFTANNRFVSGDTSLFLDTDHNGVRLARVDIGDITSADAPGSSSIFVRGFDVDPDTLAARGEFGFFDGVTSVVAVREGENPGDPRMFSSAEGTVRLVVDFDTNTVTGKFETAFPDPAAILDTNEFAFPRTRFILDETPIVGNAFEGTLDLNIGDFGEGTQLTDSGYDGRFYGLRVGSAGGTFDATIATDTGSPVVLQGGYVADDPKQAGTARFE